MFASSKGTPLNIDNFARRTIRPVLAKLEIPWHGSMLSTADSQPSSIRWVSTRRTFNPSCATPILRP
jgi:hypothetical protein